MCIRDRINVSGGNFVLGAVNIDSTTVLDLDGDNNSLSYGSFNDGTTGGNLTISIDGSFNLNNSTNIGSGNLTINVDIDNDGAETLTVGISPRAALTIYNGSAASNDSLTGPNSENIWAITAGNTGTLAGNGFTNFANLTGGTRAVSYTHLTLPTILLV